MIKRWLSKLFAKPILSKWVGSVVRTGVAALAGLSLGLGLPDVAKDLGQIAPQLADIGVALALYFFAQLWSIQEKAPDK